MFIISPLLLLVPVCSGAMLNSIWERTNQLNSPNNDWVHNKRHVKRHIAEDLHYHELPPECLASYKKIARSTMCLPESVNYIEGSAGVSDHDKKIILREHNKYRRNVKPPAKGMRKLYWDDELARLAERWAKQCIIGHDPGSGRYIPNYDTIPGQNSGYKLPDWESVLQSWKNESEIFQYGEDPNLYIEQHGWTHIANYSMMITEAVSLIGCGFARCNPGPRNFFFCNYIPRPTLLPFPYHVGLPCEKCLHNCTDSLCDCGPTFCFNGGQMNLTTCKCKCMFPYLGDSCLIDPCPGRRCKHDGLLDTDTCTCSCPYPYTGDLCEIISCDFRPDADSCESLSTDYCVFKSIKKACPMLCDVCPDFCPNIKCDNGKKNISNCQCTYPCGNKTCDNFGKLVVDTCNCSCRYPYTGEMCLTKECTGRLDPDFCKMYWPPYLCAFEPVKRFCPVMCGVCTGPCNVTCQNSGILNQDCTCKCNYPYTGTECEIESCTKKPDRQECGYEWPSAFCDKFYYVQIFCPNLCGICPAVCEGKICKNQGRLNVDTCACICHQNYTGVQCEKDKCGTKKCLNYGTLDILTCECKCPPNYSGDVCDVWTCPEEDNQECGSNTMPSYHCFTHWEVPFLCPYMCGHCAFNGID